MNDNDLNNLLDKIESLKVLYVEDNKKTRVQTLKMLGEFFVNIDVAVNGEDGLLFFKSNKSYDLIITDISMPVLDGIEMSKLIRSIDSNIPIIAVSAHNEKYIMDMIEQYQISAYIFKPIDLDEFIEILNKLYL